MLVQVSEGAKSHTITPVRVGEALTKEIKSRAGSADTSMVGVVVMYSFLFNRDTPTKDQEDLIKDRVSRDSILMGALCR